MFSTLLYRLQWALCFILFALIVLGAGVRLADAGLACPDWPLCFGELIPTFNTEIFLEWIHRKIALWVGVLALVISVMIWTKPSYRAGFGWWMLANLLLFCFQAVLGRETVTRFLDSYIVSAHLIGGYSLFALNLWVAMKMRRWRRKETLDLPPESRSLQIFSYVFWVSVLGQTLLGGLVSTSYAGMACGSSFPLCLGQWIPPLHGAIALHFFHRVGGFFILALACFAFYKSFKINDLLTKRLWQVVFGLVILQIIWGIGMLHSQIHFGLSLLHSATSLLIFSLLAIGSYHVRYR